MSNRAFLVVVIAVALLVSAVVYMHRPRARSVSHSIDMHGAR